MADAGGQIIYVGKARNLRRRLASYFQPQPAPDRTRQLVSAIASIEVVLVNNETEALVLEHNLIKHHRPRYNRALIDDDTGYFYIALTDEALPRLVPYRKHRSNRALIQGGETVGIARLFGPYVSRDYRDRLLGFVADHCRLRTCAPLPSRVCLRYHLSTCGGICEGKVAAPEYAAAVAAAVALLDRKSVV
jgi:excinuclease ABC subunit C